MNTNSSSVHVTLNPTVPRPRILRLDELATMSVDELTDVYRRSTVPVDLSVLDGEPTCRILAPVGPLGRGPQAGALRAFARSSRFPWAGKSFTAKSPQTGTGINRVRLAGIRNWFPFSTRVEPSVIDCEPCIFLDYERPGNPWVVRQFHDELKEVEVGLFLGPGMWKTRSKPALILYFACAVG